MSCVLILGVVCAFMFTLLHMFLCSGVVLFSFIVFMGS